MNYEASGGSSGNSCPIGTAPDHSEVLNTRHNIAALTGRCGPAHLFSRATAVFFLSGNEPRPLRRTSGRVLVRRGLQIEKSVERHPVEERQDLGGPEAADLVLAFDPEERIPQACPAQRSGRRPVGACSSFTMNV